MIFQLKTNLASTMAGDAGVPGQERRVLQSVTSCFQNGSAQPKLTPLGGAPNAADRDPAFRGPVTATDFTRGERKAETQHLGHET